MPVVYVQKATNDAILQLAERMEGSLRQAFLNAVAHVKNAVDLKKLTLAIERGDANQVLAVLAIDSRFAEALRGGGLDAGISSVRDAVANTFREAAAVASRQLPTATGVKILFDLKNPEATKFLDTYTFDLIKQTSADTKKAIQQVISRAFKEGGHPYEQARTIKNVIGLTAKQEQAVANYQAALSGGSTELRQALNRSLRDGRYDASILRALKQKQTMPAARVEAMVERYRQRYLQYRAQTIARTESIRASNKGQLALWRQAQEKGLLPADVKRKWIVSGDDRTCPICMGLHGQERSLDEEFTQDIWAPPDPHPSCRCRTALVLKSMRRVA